MRHHRFCVKTLLVALFATSGFAWAATLMDSPESVERGHTIYEETCAGCHSVNVNRIGPLHMGIVGRHVGSIKDFHYSKALQDSDLVWSRDLLLRWLTDPEKVIPGQVMGFRLKDEQERMDVVAYLATLKVSGLK